MKSLKKALSLLVASCMTIGCIATSAFAEGSVTTSAFGQQTYPTVSGNYAATVDAKVSVDVGDTVTDTGSLVLYSNYGLCTVTNWDYIGVTKVSSNNPSVATAEISYSGSTLSVDITGVANGTATITVDYCGQTTVNSNQIYSGTNGVANGYIKYTVTVGTGTSSGGGTTDPVDPNPSTEGWIAIHNQAELEAVANDLNGKYYLANDITVTGNWTPLGWTDGDDQAFTGIFDGQGYEISGLSLNAPAAGNLALFAINNGTIQNLEVSVGTLVGYQNIAAVAGENNGLIQDVHVVGGNLIECTNDYSGAQCAGGLVGFNGVNGRILRCSASGVEVAAVNYGGGLVGQNYGYIDDSFSTCPVNERYYNDVNYGYLGLYWAGGLVGGNGNTGEIRNCYVYATGMICATQCVGGFAGLNKGLISGSYVAHNNHIWGGSEGTITVGRVNGGTAEDCYVAPSSTSGTVQGFTRVTSVSGLYDVLDEEYFKSAASYSYPVLYWQVDGWERPPYDDEPGEDEPEPEEYTVTFEAIYKAGDIVDLPEDMVVEEGTVIYLTEPTRTNSNNWVYRFCGWECDVDGETYDVGAPYTVNSDVTFTASWKLITVNGGESWTYLDAMAILDYLAGEVTFTDEQEEVADYDNDGDISYLDAMAIMDVLAGANN